MSLSADLLPGVPLVESPLFAGAIETGDWTDEERAAARSLNERGYAVIDFPDPDILARIDRIKVRLAPGFGVDLNQADTHKSPGALRVQDAWRVDADVKAIAANANVLTLLGKLYGRDAFPFQTLNFPVGTEQHPHTDSVHFSSQPERFMCGVWLAFEDMHPDAGPLLYYPGSHKWPILTNAMIGRRGWGSKAASAQTPFESAWRAMVDATGLQPETFLARKGQALIWAANLLHGGSPQTDPTRTRWSQVTHYYFKDCIYYTPAFSDEPFGRLDLRSITNIASGDIEPNTLLGETAVPTGTPGRKLKGLRRMFRGEEKQDRAALPADFDSAEYYRRHPDVAESGMDAADHYIDHGRAEGRIYRGRS